ncbi:hypothetical protein [Cellulomonas sp. HZM]|uniref:hypothetical protein n=1 Tax=Cellulomonas sp. HZM TaxID=1454010 RepID=UPI0012DBFFE5|nr:hypothetical protein [Cellulomonas sp. HZM]
MLLAGIVVGSAACSGSDELPSGSLSIGSGAEEWNCPDPGVRTTQALGAMWVTNTGTAPIKIRKVELVAPHDVQVDPAFLVPEGGLWYTVSGDVPPPARGDKSAADAWSRRVTPDEAVIRPGQLWEIVVPMRTLSDDASFEATRIEYDEDGTRRVGRDATAMAIDGKGPGCGDGGQVNGR